MIREKKVSNPLHNFNKALLTNFLFLKCDEHAEQM